MHLKMIKLTYETHIEGAKNPELTTVNIFSGKIMIRWNISGKAKVISDQMNKDGKKGVFLWRGVLVQYFKDKTEEEILDIVKKDIESGVLNAEIKTKKTPIIKNIKIENLK